MASVLRSTSKLVKGLFIAASLAALAGCAATEGLLAKDLRLTSFGASEEVIAVEPVVEAKAIVVPDAQSKPVITPAASAAETSAWCEYLREDTAAQTSIVRSPSLRGSVADDGTTGVSLSLSATDFLKANLMEESAEARCRRHLAETGLQKLVFLAPQGLTSAGFKAKLKSIEGQKKEIARLSGKAQRAMQNGVITRDIATSVALLADQLHAEANAARSQADRRIHDGLMPDATAKQFGHELLLAESDLEDINSRMRTLDALDFSVSAGWNDEVDKNGFDVTNESFSGKLSMSVKLGALVPQRFAHEEAAKSAKLRAISEEGGPLWQAAVLKRAHERAIEGLTGQERNLAQAIQKAEGLAKMLASVPGDEFEGPLIQAKMQLIKLRADRAGVSGSIAEIRSNLKKLNAG